MGLKNRRELLTRLSAGLLGGFFLQFVACSQSIGKSIPIGKLEFFRLFKSAGLLPYSAEIMNQVDDSIDYQARKNLAQNECSLAMRKKFNSDYVELLIDKQKQNLALDLIENLSSEEQIMLASLTEKHQQEVFSGLLDKIIKYRSKSYKSFAIDLDNQLRSFAGSYLVPSEIADTDNDDENS